MAVKARFYRAYRVYGGGVFSDVHLNSHRTRRSSRPRPRRGAPMARIRHILKPAKWSPSVRLRGLDRRLCEPHGQRAAAASLSVDGLRREKWL